MQKRLVTFVIAALAIPALAAAQKVSYDYEKSANFPSFKTYAHKDGTKVGQPLIDDRIIAAIDAAARGKRVHKGGSESGRLCGLPRGVRQTEGYLDVQLRVRRWVWCRTGGDGAAARWAGTTSTTQVRDILVGTMVIDLADAKKGQLVWRGMGVKEVQTQANPEKRDKSINNAVKKIFKNYPPKQKT